MFEVIYNTSVLEWVLFSIPIIPIMYILVKFQNFNFTIQNEFVRTFLQLLELVCIALLFPYSLLIMLTPFVWLYEIFGWFAVILFPLIYGFILVRLTEFYMKFKKNKS